VVVLWDWSDFSLPRGDLGGDAMFGDHSCTKDDRCWGGAATANESCTNSAVCGRFGSTRACCFGDAKGDANRGSDAAIVNPGAAGDDARLLVGLESSAWVWALAGIMNDCIFLRRDRVDCWLLALSTRLVVELSRTPITNGTSMPEGSVMLI
jgi:hypothetical protein